MKYVLINTVTFQPVGGFADIEAVERVQKSVPCTICISGVPEILDHFTENAMRHIRAYLKMKTQQYAGGVESFMDLHPVLSVRQRDKKKAAIDCWEALEAFDWGNAPEIAKGGIKSFLRQKFHECESWSLNDLLAGGHSRSSLQTAFSDLKNEKYSGGELLFVEKFTDEDNVCFYRKV